MCSVYHESRDLSSVFNVLRVIQQALTKRPDLIDEWNFEKNGSLQIEYISYSSNKKIWWRCRKCGYEWLSPPSNRIRGCDCPVCSGNIVVPGLNDLKTTHPHIACYWDYTRNGHLSPERVSSGSGKHIWWKCSKCGYVWKTSVVNRTRSSGCPKCNGYVLSPEISLEKRFPEIAHQWDQIKNDNLPLDVFPSSEKNVWWRCSRGHEWQTSISSRTHGNNCPYCGNKKVLSGFNDLATIHPELAKEWCTSRNITTTDKVLAGSCKKFWWKCVNDHEYQASVNNRVSGTGCPYCDGKKPVVGKNDLQSTHPEIADEWLYEKNEGLKPNQLKAGSNKKVWWKCKSCGGEWQALVWSRCKGRGCPYCAGKRSVIGVNDLCTTHPQLIIEWNYSKNKVSPASKLHGSRYKAWWKCKVCGFEWEATIGSRSAGRGCPRCAGKR